eukprot:gene33968-43881_t
MRQYPHRRIIPMAAMDAIQFIVMTYATLHVPPLMTVLLLYAAIPSSLFMAKYLFPSRQYTQQHYWGVAVTASGILLSLANILWTTYFESESYTALLASAVYLIASAVQGISSSVKEKLIVEWHHPVNIYQYSSWLFFYQFLFTVLFSILYFVGKAVVEGDVSVMEGAFAGWTAIFVWNTDDSSSDDMDDYYSDDVKVPLNLWLIAAYVLHSFLGHSVSPYSSSPWPAHSHHHTSIMNQYGISLIDVVSVLLLVLGSEIYGFDAEPPMEPIANFASAPAGPGSNHL